MLEEFIFDLKVARKKSGLLQSDCGHLLGLSNKTVSDIEVGRRIPTMREMCILSLIFGRRFDSFYSEMLARSRREILDKLPSLPDPPAGWPRSIARKRSLGLLVRRLHDDDDEA